MGQVNPIIFKNVPPLASLMAGFPSMKVLLFDMDGTLFDTEKYHTLALQAIGQEQKISPPVGPEDLHKLLMGKADHLIYELIKDWPGFPKLWGIREFVNEKNRHLLLLLRSVTGKTYFPETLKKLLNEASAQGLKLGLVTSSEKVITNELLKLAEIEKMFNHVLTRNDCSKVKPDPWPYVRAMELFDSGTHETVIFEDSSIGLESARGSGAHVIKAEWF